MALVDVLTPTAPDYWEAVFPFRVLVSIMRTEGGFHGLALREAEPDQVTREPETLVRLRREPVEDLCEASLEDLCRALSVELLAREPRLEQALRLTSPEELEDYDPEDDGYDDEYPEGLELEEEDPIGDELPGLRVALFGDSSFELREDSEPEDPPFRLFGRAPVRESGGGFHIDFGPWRVQSFGVFHAALQYQDTPLFELTEQDMVESGDFLEPEAGAFFEYVEGYLRGFFQGALRQFGIPEEESSKEAESEPLLSRVAGEDLF